MLNVFKKKDKVYNHELCVYSHNNGKNFLMVQQSWINSIGENEESAILTHRDKFKQLIDEGYVIVVFGSKLTYFLKTGPNKAIPVRAFSKLLVKEKIESIINNCMVL